MYCWKCGAPHVEGAEFCPNCGIAANPIHTKPDYSTEAVNREYAGFWIRFMAYLIDLFLCSLGLVILVVVPMVSMNGTDAMGPGLFFMSVIFANIAFWLYFILMESSRKQGTLGKQAMGIVVVDEFGARISPARATGRFAAKTFLSSILCIGFIMAAFTDKKKALHDMLADTVVKHCRELR